jgi:hypothetical protein
MSELNSRVNGSQLLKQGKLLSPSALSERRSQMFLCIDGCKKLLVTQWNKFSHCHDNQCEMRCFRLNYVRWLKRDNLKVLVCTALFCFSLFSCMQDLCTYEGIYMRIKLYSLINHNKITKRNMKYLKIETRSVLSIQYPKE